TKKRVPSTAVRLVGRGPPVHDGQMFFTITVPAGVPSVFHSSKPCPTAPPRKYTAPFMYVKAWSTPASPERSFAYRSPMMAVPPSVPSVRHRCGPPELLPLNNAVPLKAAMASGETSSTSGYVPAGVASVRHAPNRATEPTWTGSEEVTGLDT